MPSGLDCGSGTKLAEADKMLFGVVSDGEYAYWIEQTILQFSQTETKVLRAPVAGGAAATLAMGTAIDLLAVDDTNLFWRETQEATNGPQAIHRGPKAGGAADTVVASGRLTGDLTLDASNLYFGALLTPAGGGAATVTLSRVGKTAAAGTTPVVICKGSNIMAGFSTQVVVLGGTAYWGKDVQVFSTALAGTDQTCASTLIDPLSNMKSMAGDGTDLFYTGYYLGKDELFRRPTAGGTATKLSDISAGHPVVARGGKIYFALNGLQRMNADGTGATMLTSYSPNYLTSIAADDAAVYYAVGTGAGAPTVICKIAR
jgi:hypothetical protein